MPPVPQLQRPRQGSRRCGPGWRAVTHPERLRPRRTAGSDANSDAPRFRVYAWKTQFPDPELLTTQEEPFVDANAPERGTPARRSRTGTGTARGTQGSRSPSSSATGTSPVPRTPPRVPRSGCSACPAAWTPTGAGRPTPTFAWAAAPCYPEHFTDANANGIHEVAEPWLDLDGNGARDRPSPTSELDGNGVFTRRRSPSRTRTGTAATTARGRRSPSRTPTGTGRWDPPRPYWDVDGNGQSGPPTTPRLALAALEARLTTGTPR